MVNNVTAAASTLVSETVLDCLLQCLMNKGILLPSEVNDIFEASGLLLAQKGISQPEMAEAFQLAQDEIADRLGLKL